MLLVVALCAGVVSSGQADPYPPYWQGGSGSSIHFPVAQWPGETGWIPYTKEGTSISDDTTRDPSNGGTSPQGYVNVSSGCPENSLPSSYYQYDPSRQTIFYRWRVEAGPNNYATGPSAGAYSSTSPWNSAQWTILFDLDGDGYREFAVHLDGSSGGPSTAIDRLVSIYSDSRSQSIDYINDPNVHLLYHNPTAFVDIASSRILNFHNTLAPTADWPNGSSETVWDYGTTRATRVITPLCTEYLIDYQIPLAFLDASAYGGIKMTADTPFAMLFVTANSLNNPMQKDASVMGDYIADPNLPAPFGDTTSLNGSKPLTQPLVTDVTVAGCGSSTLQALVNDSVRNDGSATLTEVGFYYYHDVDGNGLADDGGSWALAAAASSSSLGVWSATWNSSTLSRGQYLIGVQAVDDATLNAGGKANRTFSYLSAAEVGGLTPPSGEVWAANPAPEPGVVYASLVNTCGTPPASIQKSVTPSEVDASGGGHLYADGAKPDRQRAATQLPKRSTARRFSIPGEYRRRLANTCYVAVQRRYRGNYLEL